MIEPIPHLPDHVLGFTASGKVTGTDYEQHIIPAVEATVQQHDKINLIYHIREDFTGFDMAAAWDDTKMGLKHLTSWHRLAIVSDVPWIRTGVRAVGFLMPCEVRIFPIAELSEATAWVSEKEA